MNTDVAVIPVGKGDFTTAGARWYGEQTTQRPPKAAMYVWLLTRDHALIRADRIMKHNVTFLCQLITSAWQHILPEEILKGFRKCCISYVME
jgi:hypothetical protein